MITMSYTSGVIAAVAAAAVGATGAGWMLYGAIIENRILVSRIQRWERRTARTPLWTSRLSGYHTTGFYGLHMSGPRPRIMDGRVVLTIQPPPPAPLAITSGLDTVDSGDDVDFDLADVDSIVDDRGAELAMRRNAAEVRRALRCTERLLMQSRRQHIARHRLNPAPPRTRRPHSVVVGHPQFPWRVNRPAEAVAA